MSSMSEWSKLHAKITESEAGAPSFDATFPEGLSEWDLIGPDGLDYQGLRGDWLLSPTLRAQSGVSSMYDTATGIDPERMIVHDNLGVSFSGPCQSAPLPLANHMARVGSSVPLSEAPSAQREIMNGVKGRELEDNRVMGGNTNAETASIPAPKITSDQVHPQYWAGGRIYWWKQRCAAIATTNDRDWNIDIVSQALKEGWYPGDENGFPIKVEGLDT